MPFHGVTEFEPTRTETVSATLCVFAGGCTLEAAEAVCDAGLDLGINVIDGLSSLVDKNLIQRTDREPADPRFSMLQTIREFAMEKLDESREATITRRAHAAYSMVIAEEGNPDLDPEERKSWLSRCDLEIDNFRQALDWLIEARDRGMEPAPRRRAFPFLGYARAPERRTRPSGSHSSSGRFGPHDGAGTGRAFRGRAGQRARGQPSHRAISFHRSWSFMSNSHMSPASPRH